MRSSKRVATGGILAALCVVLMLLGTILELGMYLCPMLCGLLLSVAGQRYGRKYHTMLWLVTSLLCFLLVPGMEANLLFAGFLGWYPILHPVLQKIPNPLRMVVKLLIFNASIIAIEALVLLVLVPEFLDTVLIAILLILANITFLLFDRLIPVFSDLLRRIFPSKR